MTKTSEWLLNSATVIATLCAVTVVGFRVHDAIVGSGPPKTTLIANWQEYSKAGLRSGAQKPRVTIVEFSDFQCPFCRKAAQYLDQVQRRYPNDIAIVYRHFPVHPFAHQAAVAAECANSEGMFQPVHDRLFAQPDSIGRETWWHIAHDAGLRDSTRFLACMKDVVPDRRVQADSVAGIALGVEGTPTFLVNGLRVRGYLGDDAMDKFIADALRQSRGADHD